MKFWLALVIVVCGMSFNLPRAHADLGADNASGWEPSRPLEWQKVDLEEKVHAKISASLAHILPESAYVLTVSIQLKDHKKTADGKADPADGPRLSLGKLDMEAPTEEAEEQEQNLFQNIGHWSVAIILDKGVTPAKEEVIKKIVNAISSTVGQPPALTVERAELVAPPPPPEVKPSPAPAPSVAPAAANAAPAEAKPWDAKQWLIEMKTPIGILAATFVFSFTLFVVVILLTGGYRKIEREKIELMAARNAREEKLAAAATEAASSGGAEPHEAEPAADKHASGSGGGGAHVAAAAAGEGSGAEPGVEKFRALLAQSPEKAALLVRQWIKAPVGDAAVALAALPTLLETEQFSALFKYLGAEDRRGWRKALNAPLGLEDLAKAQAYISSQIVDSVLAPPSPAPALSSALSELTLAQCVALASEDPAIGGVLANLLPAGQVAQVFALMDPEQANGVVLSALKIADTDIARQAESMIARLNKLKQQGQKSVSPFLDRAAEVLQDVDAAREARIFAALAASGELEVFERAARRLFPSELVPQLPPKILKAAFDRFPITRRAEILLGRPDDERERLLEIFGKAGSKGRDILDVEFQQIDKDELRKKRIARHASEAWRELVTRVRELLAANVNFREQAEAVLVPWLSEQTGGRIGGGEGTAAGEETHAA